MAVSSVLPDYYAVLQNAELDRVVKQHVKERNEQMKEARTAEKEAERERLTFLKQLSNQD